MENINIKQLMTFMEDCFNKGVFIYKMRIEIKDYAHVAKGHENQKEFEFNYKEQSVILTNPNFKNE